MDEIEKRKDNIMELKDKIFSILFDNTGKIDSEIKAGIKDLITECDFNIEQLIVNKIADNFPNDTIIGEEYGVSNQGKNGFEWHIDPIDGTNNFINGFPDFGTSIGLVQNGEIVMGVVFYSDGKIYWAIKDHGAYADDIPLKVSDRSDVKDMLIGMHFHFDPVLAKKDFASLLTYYEEIRGFRVLGSAVGTMLMVATGALDMAWSQEYTYIFDFVACAIIVKEAGGIVTNDKDLDNFIKPQNGFVFASNGKIHKRLVHMLIDNYEKS